MSWTGSPAAPAQAEALPIDVDRLALVRAVVTRHGARAALPPERIEDLVLAVNELATNSVVHGGGHGQLRVWEEADGLVCEVRDRGVFDEPLAGRPRPDPDQIGSYGLWIVTQLCDRVEQRTPPGGGNVMRVTMRRERPRPSVLAL